jgi:hypothetical protein
VNLLIGGGNDINNLYVGVYRASTNALIARVTGAANEAYSRVNINAASAIGVSCYLKVVDNATGGFGHINVDDIQIPTTGGARLKTNDEEEVVAVPEDNVKVYPMPVQDNFIVDLSGYNKEEDIALEMSDVSGRTIEKMKASAEKHSFSAKSLGMHSGLYLIKVQSARKIKVLKIIVQ